MYLLLCGVSIYRAKQWSQQTPYMGVYSANSPRPAQHTCDNQLYLGPENQEQFALWYSNALSQKPEGITGLKRNTYLMGQCGTFSKDWDNNPNTSWVTASALTTDSANSPKQRWSLIKSRSNVSTWAESSHNPHFPLITVLKGTAHFGNVRSGTQLIVTEVGQCQHSRRM